MIEDPQPSDPTRQLHGSHQNRVVRFAAVRLGSIVADRYELLEPLGAGGSAQVYRARERGTDREVAIKMFYPQAQSDAAWRVVQREIRLIAALDHPGIVRVEHVGEADGLIYLVMELLHGQSLRDRLLEPELLSRTECERILEQLLEALAVAHYHDVVHRDIKPANIFLTQRVDPVSGIEREQAVLLDFGLARGLTEETLTETGAFLGTPEYASPEQVRGDKRIGPPSDLYSLAIVGWQLLSGRTPHGARSLLEVMQQQLDDTQVLSARTLKRAPAWLCDLLLWMLEKLPSERPTDASEALAWYRARRRRPLATRIARQLRHRARRRIATSWRLASIATLVAAAGAAVWVIQPTHVETTATELIFRNRLEGAVRRIQLPQFAKTVLPLRSAGLAVDRQLVVFGTTAGSYQSFPARYPFGMGIGSPLSSELTPFMLRDNDRVDDTVPSVYDRFDNTFAASELTPLTRSSGATLYAVNYRHLGGGTGLVVLFDAAGQVHAWIHHPGVVLTVTLVAATHGDTVVLRAINNDLGMREVMLGVALPPGVPRPSRKLIVGGSKGEFFSGLATVVFYTSLPGQPAGTSTQQPVYGSGSTDFSTVDLTTGVPTVAAGRGALGHDVWLRSQHRLLDLLAAAAVQEQFGQMRDVAVRLTEYAGQADVSRAQAGTALYRAAVLLRKLGDLKAARKALEKALEIEPEFSGHHRLLFDIAARLGDWELLHAQANYVIGSQGWIVAALLFDRLDFAEALPEPPRRGDPRTLLAGSIVGTLLLDLHRARPEAALASSRRLAPESSYPTLRFLRSLSLALCGPEHDREALEHLAPLEAGQSAGIAFPALLLRGFIDARRDGPLPARAQIEVALGELQNSTEADLLPLYFVPWAEALAARIERARGDRALANRHWQRALRSPGRGPYLTLIDPVLSAATPAG